jgi:ureidoglycolate hydrolase
MPTIFNPKRRNAIFINTGGTVSPTPTPPSFSNTKSLAFDGVDESVDVGDFSSYDNGDFSASLWINTPSTRSASDYVLSNSGSGSKAGFDIVINRFGSVKALRNTTTSDTDSGFQSVGLTLNTWHHIAFTYTDATRTLKLYFDGSLINTSIGSASTNSASTSLTIGSYINTSNFYLGNIDEISLYNTVLSDADIGTIATAPSDLSTYNPVAWYRMGDNSTYQTPQILMPENTNKDKVSNYSFNFDGVSDYVATPSLTSLGMGTTDLISVSLWFKTNATKTFPTAFNTGGWPLTSGVNIYLDSTTNNIGTRVNNVVTTTSGTNYRDDNWHHVLLCYNGSLGSNQIELFVDGVSVGTNTLTGNITSTTTDIHIGANTNTSVGTFRGWEDNVDEVAIWNTDQRANISSIYNSGTPTTISGATAYWKLGEQAKFTDNWLVSNSALSNYSNYSFNFDGVDDVINIANPTSFTDTGDFSISAWIKYTTTGAVHIFNIRDNRILYVSSGRIIGAFRNSGGGFVSITSPSLYNDNQWHHALFVKNSTNLILYVDGTQVAINSNGGATQSGGTSFARISARASSSTPTNIYGGFIDEVSFYESDQSANVSTIYNGGEPTTISGAVSHWKMGEDATYNASTSEWTIPDQVGSNDGTSSNTMALDTLVGEAPNYFGGGLSDAMTIEDRVGNAPNSSNNAVSFNMEADDIDNNTP